MLVSLTEGPGGLVVEHGLIRAPDLDAVLEAAEAARRWQRQCGERRTKLDAECEAQLETARQQARLLLEQAQAEIGAWQVQAQQRMQAEAEAAHMQGYEAGRTQALADWHAQQAEQARRLQAEARSVQAPLARVVCDAVAAIVCSSDPQALYQRALAQVQASCRAASRMRLHVSSDDEAAAASALSGSAAGDMQVELVVHADLAAGSCIAETDAGYVDASLELQLAALRGAMDRAVLAFERQAPAGRDEEA